MDNTRDDYPEIDSYATRCVVHVKNRFGLELDYTSDTLSVLDHFVSGVVADECEGVIPPVGDRRRSHLIHLLAPTLGAYFGEVIRSQFQARWRFTAREPHRWVLEFEDFFLRLNPAGAAADAIMGETVEDWSGSLVTAPDLIAPLHERLAMAPPVPEDEFFTFASRLEVIQISGDYLRERANADGKVSFHSEDYDKVFGD